MLTITIVIDSTTHYLIPGTDDKYYISTTGDVYSVTKHRYITKEGNTVKLAINGSYKRYSCDKLLIEALLTHIEDIKSFI